MKKQIIAIILTLCCWVQFSGFAYVESGALVPKSGRINEVITMACSQEDATKLGVDFETLSGSLNQAFLITKEYVQNLYYLAIQLDDEIDAEKKEYLQININFTVQQSTLYVQYNYRDCWDYMCGTIVDATEETVENHLFTNKTSIKMPLKISSINYNSNEINLFELVYTKVIGLMKLEYPNIEQIMLPTYKYTYATYNTKIHSTANSVSYSANDGMNYHTWVFENDGSLPTIEFWQISVNSYIWYISAIVLSGIFALALLLIYKYGKTTKKSSVKRHKKNK